MIKTDGRDSAKCQKSKSEDMIGIIEFDLMIIASVIFLNKKRKGVVAGPNNGQ